MSTPQHDRMQELEQMFSQLESKIGTSPEKEALSILHAMILVTRRELAFYLAGDAQSSDHSLDSVANLYKSAPGMQGSAENEGLPVGTKAPDFTLLDVNAMPVSLSDFQGKFVMLVFYPLDWSPACSDQLSLYQSELGEFEKYDTQVIGISVDSLYSHGAWSAVRGITFPLLADFHPKGQIAQLYNVMRKKDGFSERALYIIDPQGTIRFSHVSPELPHIPDIYELFEQLAALNQPS